MLGLAGRVRVVGHEDVGVTCLGLGSGLGLGSRLGLGLGFRLGLGLGLGLGSRLGSRLGLGLEDVCVTVQRLDRDHEHLVSTSIVS